MRGGSYRILPLTISFSYTSSGTGVGGEALLHQSLVFAHSIAEIYMLLVAVQLQYGAGLLQDQIKCTTWPIERPIACQSKRNLTTRWSDKG